jgi:hypothetical protein
MRFQEHYFTEADTSKATGLEKTIVDIWNGLTIDDPLLSKPGENVVTFLKDKQKIKEKSATHTGRKGSEPYPLTDDWKKWGGIDKTPKTDLIIGEKYFISLKAGSSAQLMSGSKGESKATFNAALNGIDVTKYEKGLIDKIEKAFENFVSSSLSKHGNVQQDIDAGDNPVIINGQKAHTEMKTLLQDFFNSNEDFQNAFAREAMTGIAKFGHDSEATATHVLAVTDEGEKNALHNLQDVKYIKEVADRMKLVVRFKSTSQKIGGEKTGKYRFWSVISLIQKNIKESFDIDESLLTEGKVEEIWNNVKNFIKGVLNKIYEFIKKGLENLIEFLEINVEDEDINVDNSISFY